MFFFQKNSIFPKKTKILNVLLRNLTVSVAFYGKFSTIWSKENFTLRNVNERTNCRCGVNAIGKLVKKRRLWPIWVEDFASILYNVAQNDNQLEKERFKLTRIIKIDTLRTKCWKAVQKYSGPNAAEKARTGCIEGLIISHKKPRDTLSLNFAQRFLNLLNWNISRWLTGNYYHLQSNFFVVHLRINSLKVNRRN